MRFQLDDGYTLDARTLADIPDRVTGELLFQGLPVIEYRYRPALPDALAEWRYTRGRASSGRGEVEATANLVVDHLVSWDVGDATGRAIPIIAANVRRIPEPILNQIVESIVTWAPKAEAVAGNSPGVSA